MASLPMSLFPCPSLSLSSVLRILGFVTSLQVVHICLVQGNGMKLGHTLLSSLHLHLSHLGPVGMPSSQALCQSGTYVCKELSDTFMPAQTLTFFFKLLSPTSTCFIDLMQDLAHLGGYCLFFQPVRIVCDLACSFSNI